LIEFKIEEKNYRKGDKKKLYKRKKELIVG